MPDVPALGDVGKETGASIEKGSSHPLGKGGGAVRRADYERTLRHMEQCSELMQDAEPRELRRLQREYRAMSDSILPYVHGEMKFSDDPPP